MVGADIMPTLHALAGLTLEPHRHGQDLARLVYGLGGVEPESIHIEGVPSETMGGLPDEDDSAATHLDYHTLVTREWSYVERYDGTCRFLFDMLNDPYQLDNLAEDPGLEPTRAELSELLTAWKDGRAESDATGAAIEL